MISNDVYSSSEFDRSLDEALRTVFELMPQGAVLLTGTARILLINRTARRLIESNGGVRVTDGTLVAATPYYARLLRQAIRSSCHSGSGVASALSIPCAPRPPITAVILPLGNEISTRFPGGMVLMLLSDSDATMRCDEAILRKWFHLTPAESKIAALMMNGKSLEEVTAELKISKSTTRNHLKRIFGKTGTNRQGELVSLLLRSPAIFSWPRTQDTGVDEGCGLAFDTGMGVSAQSL